MPKLSIILPTYEVDGKGVEMLNQHFKQFKIQTFTDFDIVIADSTKETQVAKYLESKKDFDIKYVKVENPKNLYSHINEGIKKASGDIFHIICMEDYFYNKHSLQRIADNFKPIRGWQASTYMHTKDRLGLFRRHVPAWNANILNNNTLGCISCLTMLKDNEFLFDDSVELFADTDFYYRLYKKYGMPELLDEIIWIQVLSDARRPKIDPTEENANAELKYLTEKHSEKKSNV